MNRMLGVFAMALCAALALSGAANAAGPDYNQGPHPSYEGQRPPGPPPGARGQGHGPRRHGPPPPRCTVESVRGPKVMLHCDKTDRITPGSQVVVLKPRPHRDGRHGHMPPPPRDGRIPPPRDARPPALTR